MKRTRSRLMSGLSLLIVCVSLLTACGGGATQAGIAGEPDPDGVLRYGYPMPVAGLHLDPAQSVLTTDVVWMSLVYGSLMRQSADGALEGWMAESAEVVDPQTVKFILRPGVTFSDGAMFDAEAVRTSLMRAKVPATPAALGGQDQGMKALADVEVLDPLTAVVKLNQPVAGQFLVEMSQRSGSIVSPKQIAENSDQIDTAPIGAGPFIVVGNTPQQMLSFRKNPGYWDTESIRLGGIDIVNTPVGPQQANGLLAGDLDWASYLPVDATDRIGADGRFNTDVTSVYNLEILMCTDKAPFDNEDVRRAVQKGVDRERLSEVVYRGLAGPAYSFFREENRNFAASIKDEVVYDPTQAKALLNSSGISNPTMDLHFATTLNLGSDAEVLQSQLQGIGMTVNLMPERDGLAGFITPKLPGALLFATIGNTGFGVYSRIFGPGGPLGLCGVDRPDVMALVNEAAGLAPDDPAAIAAYQKAQQIVAEHAYTVPLLAYPTIAGWNSSRVGGNPVFNAQGTPQFESLYISK